MKIKNLIKNMRKRYDMIDFKIHENRIITSVETYSSAHADVNDNTLYLVLPDDLESALRGACKNIVVVSQDVKANSPNSNLIFINTESRAELFKYITSQLELYSIVEATLEDIYDAFSKEDYMENVLTIIYEFIGNPIMYHDQNHSVMGYMPKHELADHIWMSTVQDGRYAYSRIDQSFYREYEKMLHGVSPSMSMTEGSDYTWYVYPIKYRNAISGFLITFNYNKSISEHESDFLLAVSKAFALRDMKDKSIVVEDELKIKALLSGEYSDPKSIDVLLKNQGISHRKNYGILVTDESNDITVFTKQLHITLMNRIDVYQYKYDGYHILILAGSTDYSIGSFADNIEAFSKENKLPVGASQIFEDLSAFKRYYDQSKKALCFGKIFDSQKYYFPYSKYKMHDYLYRNCANDRNSEFYNEVVISLEEYDNEHNSELEHTLFVYLSNHKSINCTSKALNIHKNTVGYRINQIKNITGFDFDSDDEVFHTLLSYKLKYMKKLYNEGAFHDLNAEDH